MTLCNHPKKKGKECKEENCPPISEGKATYYARAVFYADRCDYMEGADAPMKDYTCQKCNTTFQDLVTEYGTITCPQCDFVVFRARKRRY